MSLGSLFSQVTFHASISLYDKTSFTGANDNKWEKATLKDFPDFSFWQSAATRYDSKRLGISGGLKYNRHRLELGIHYDGVADEYYLLSDFYDPFYGTSRPGRMSGTGNSSQSRFFVNYDFIMLNRDKKTNLYVTPTVGLCFRAGPKGIGPVGSIGSSATLNEGNTILTVNNAAYTAVDKYAINYGLGIGSDLYYKGIYILSPSLSFIYSKKYLYFTERTLTISDYSGNTVYNFDSFARCTGFYIGISRKFQIYPWKKLRLKELFGNDEETEAPL